MSYFPSFLSTYDGYKKEINRVDAIRYFLLLKLGGFYVDMDTECLQPLDRLLNNDVLLVEDVHRHFLGLNNGVMGAVPNHPLMQLCVDNLPKAANLPAIMLRTGPPYLTHAYRSLTTKDNIQVLTVKELEKIISHRHDASWTPVAQWIKALNPERRKHMKPEEVPYLLRFFLRDNTSQK